MFFKKLVGRKMIKSYEIKEILFELIDLRVRIGLLIICYRFLLNVFF